MAIMIQMSSIVYQFSIRIFFNYFYTYLNQSIFQLLFMKKLYVQTLQILTVFIYSLFYFNIIAFFCSLAIIGFTLIPNNVNNQNSYINFNTFILMLSVLASFGYKFVIIILADERINLIVLLDLGIALLLFCEHLLINKNDEDKIVIPKRYLIPLFLICLSFIIRYENWMIQYCEVGFFSLACFVFRIKSDKIQNMFIFFLKLLIMVQSLDLYRRQQNITGICMKFLVIFLGQLIRNTNNLLLIQKHIQPVSQQIQMKLIQSQAPLQSILPDQIHQPIENIYNSSISKPGTQHNLEALNIVLLVPFFLLPESIIQIPIYLYMMVLEYTNPYKFLKYLMYITINALYIINFDKQIISQILSLSIIFIMNLQVNIESQLIKLQALWLRWCFIVILAVLFWFGLREVNIFHLVLMIILLLFVTRGSESGKKSFRNRNWKYLLLLFNVFTIVRYIFSILASQGDIENKKIYALIGLSFDYNTGFKFAQNFNFFPVLVNVLVVLQYWTYLSKVYNNQSKKVNQLFKVYIDIFKKIFKLTTIIYYKTLVWIAYTIILLILVLEQYSLGSNLLLLIILMILMFHICEIRIEILYQLWLIFQRLIGLLIFLRYFFEFSKFENIYNWIKDYSLFQFLYKYQKVLGLSIEYTSETYFHTITKFQLMIALDMGMLLLSFLVLEYLQILIKVASDEDNQEMPKIRQIYNNFIEINIVRNSLVDKLLQPLRFLAKFYIKVFYLLVTLYITIHFRYFGLPYIFIFLYYYYTLNSYEYDLISKQKFSGIQDEIIQINANQNNQAQLRWYSRFYQKIVKIFITESNDQSKKYNLIAKVRELLQAWHVRKKYSTDAILQQIQMINKNIFSKRIQLHKMLRKYFVIFTYANFSLVYFAQLIYRPQILDFINDQQILNIKWYYFIYGQIHPGIKPFFHCIFPFIIFFMMIILEWKSCQLAIQNFEIEFNQQLIQDNRQRIQINRLSSVHELRNTSKRLAIERQSKIESSMKITLLLGISKLTQRSYAMFLVYTSTIKNTPYSILYLLLAFILNSVGTVSLMGLSNILLIVILSQYLLIILNYENQFIYSIIPSDMQQFMLMNPFRRIVTDPKWVKYWTFGKDHQQIIIFIIGIVLICSYQTYYWIIIKISNQILKIMSNQYKILFSQKIFTIIQSLYKYLIIFSPLYITLISIGLYISDYTLTNLVLCLMSIVFLYKQYLNQQISNIKQTRGFWKTYYRLLQAFIIIFMVSYCILSIPQYNKYCNQLLCSESQYKSKIGKAALILLFQIGIDLLKSKEYENQMLNFYEQFLKRAKILRLAISFKQNDLKINHRFDIHTRNVNLKKKRDQLLDFLDRLKHDNTLKYDSRDHIQPQKSSLLNLLLTFLPNLTDPLIMMSRSNANQIIQKSNQKYIYFKKFEQDVMSKLDKKYKLQFKYELQAEQLINQIKQFKQQVLTQFENRSNQHQVPIPRYSIAPDKFCQELLEEQVRRSQIYHEDEQPNQSVNSNQNQKKTVVYQLFVYAFVSNWQYLIYLFMIIEHIHNNGILTLYYPIAVFCFGLVQQYQAHKLIWMITYVYTLIILILKYLIGLEIIIFSEYEINVLIGHNTSNSLLQFIIFMVILFQVLFLQTIGLYNQMISLVEPVKIAIVRHLIQNQDPQVDIALFNMLQDTKYLAKNFFQALFYRSSQKKGYDYSTLVTTIQIISLVYTFLFYDRMFIENKISFYQMIEYNQFTGGMVLWILIQLGIMLLDRFISILNLRGYSHKWDLTLILKYLLLLITIIIIHYFVMIYIPSTNQYHEENKYALIFYIIYCFYFLVSALQVRDGIDQMSRGFMQRYVWYNGYVYLVFRSIPFIFEFKVFSDWFVTKTVMRLFDWIKFEDLFGRLFVAKCNSIFLQGKKMGSKIEWWKKLLMGFPLLLCILAFIFGPLILFSNLNPLAELNQIIGGSIQLTLKINHSNQYPLYINSHINDIHTLTEAQLKNQQLIQIIQNYNIDQESVQIVNLEQYSDLYWQISEGSERKLLQQPNDSIYELVLTIKFQRKYTLSTPVYILNSIILPFQKIEDFKRTLNTTQRFRIENFYDDFIRLDNNNGLHILTRPKKGITLYAQLGQKIAKKYWVIEGGLSFAIVSDKYSKAIFGYSVMGFYISIILVVANYFRFIFQGGANLIVLSDIPTADPLLTLCESVYLARLQDDLETQDKIFWTLIDLVRSPDTIKVITGNYLQARKLTISKEKENLYIISQEDELKQKIE